MLFLELSAAIMTKNRRVLGVPVKKKKISRRMQRGSECGQFVHSFTIVHHLKFSIEDRQAGSR
jgi:hypothetical protein